MPGGVAAHAMRRQARDRVRQAGDAQTGDSLLQSSNHASGAEGETGKGHPIEC